MDTGRWAWPAHSDSAVTPGQVPRSAAPSPCRRPGLQTLSSPWLGGWGEGISAWQDGATAGRPSLVPGFQSETVSFLGKRQGWLWLRPPLTPWPGRAPRDSLPLACGLCLGPGLPEAEATPSRLRAKVVIFLLGSDPPSWLPPGLWGHSSADSVQLAQVTPGQFTLGPLLASQAVLWIACEC